MGLYDLQLPDVGGSSLFVDIANGAPTPQLNTYATSRFAGVINKSRKCYARHEAQRIASLQPPNFIKETLDPSRLESKRITGRQRYNKARQALSSYGVNPSAMQKLFFNNMFSACAQLLFKDDLETERDDFMLDLGVTRLQPQFMAITPRRFGKTYSVAMFVVAMAFAVEGLEQAIFSTGRRASSKLLDLIYSFICRLPGMKESIIRHNVETIHIQGPHGQNDIRKISSYPSKVKVRGIFVSLFGPAPIVDEVRMYTNYSTKARCLCYLLSSLSFCNCVEK